MTRDSGRGRVDISKSSFNGPCLFVPLDPSGPERRWVNIIFATVFGLIQHIWLQGGRRKKRQARRENEKESNPCNPFL